MKKELKGIVICLKCGAWGVRKYIFAEKNIVKCPCGDELRKTKGKTKRFR